MRRGRSHLRTGRLQLIHHRHSWKLRPHRHTSYAGLAFLLVLTGVVLLAFSSTSSAAVSAVNPQSGSIGLTGTVLGSAPTQAPTITSPYEGEVFSEIPVIISGNCPTGSFVMVTRNNALAGEVACSSHGTYTLQADLFDGANALVATAGDSLGEYGPPSTTVNTTYDSPSLTIPGSALVGRQLFLQTMTTVAAVSPGQTLTRTVTIVGGTAPYAVNFDWGDGTNSLVNQALDGDVSSSHIYTRAGDYRVIVKVSDAASNAAFLQLVTVINGSTSTVGGADDSASGSLPGKIVGIWPLYLGAVLVVGVFWLGERVGTGRLRRKYARA